MTFTNEPIDLGDLPQLDESTFHPLDPRHLRSMAIGHVVGALAFWVIGGVVALLTDPWALLGPLVPMVFVVLSFVRTWIDVRNIGWQVREHDISYRRGVLVRTVQTLPFVRVQHTRITRTLVQRRFGLATLHVNTAGPNIAIEGLAVADAERLKALVVERAGDLDETAS